MHMFGGSRSVWLSFVVYPARRPEQSLRWLRIKQLRLERLRTFVIEPLYYSYACGYRPQCPCMSLFPVSIGLNSPVLLILPKSFCYDGPGKALSPVSIVTSLKQKVGQIFCLTFCLKMAVFSPVHRLTAWP